MPKSSSFCLSYLSLIHILIIVTHEMQFARAIANRVIFLDGGKIVEEAAPAEFFDRPKTERAQRFLRTFTFDAVK